MYELLITVSDGEFTVKTPLTVYIEDNRNLEVNNGELTSLPATMILRNKQNKPNNALFVSDVRDKLGALITGMIKVVINAESGSVPARVEGHYIGAGEQVAFDYDMTAPGVIEILVTPLEQGKAILSMTIDTN